MGGVVLRLANFFQYLFWIAAAVAASISPVYARLKLLNNNLQFMPANRALCASSRES
jgi:hypothetical protein